MGAVENALHTQNTPQNIRKAPQHNLHTENTALSTEHTARARTNELAASKVLRPTASANQSATQIKVQTYSYMATVRVCLLQEPLSEPHRVFA